MGNFVDLTGRTFGHLKVLKRVENNEAGETCWLCKCDCGKTVIVRSYCLTGTRYRKNGRRGQMYCSKSCIMKLEDNIKDAERRRVNLWDGYDYRDILY